MMLNTQALIDLHNHIADKLESEAIAATADMETERGDDLQARADAARMAALKLQFLKNDVPDACPSG